MCSRLFLDFKCCLALLFKSQILHIVPLTLSIQKHTDRHTHTHRQTHTYKQTHTHTDETCKSEDNSYQIAIFVVSTEYFPSAEKLVRSDCQISLLSSAQERQREGERESERERDREGTKERGIEREGDRKKEGLKVRAKQRGIERERKREERD